MAAQQNFVGRGLSQLIAWLAVPRVMTLPLLILLGLAGGQTVWLWVDSVKLIGWAAGIVAPFCMVCATSVWAMRDRLDDVVDTELMSSHAYQAFTRMTAVHRKRSTAWSGAAALAGLFASTPAVSSQLVGPIWQWMVLAGGSSIAVAIYAYLLANYWEVQTRAFKSKQVLESKKLREHQALIDDITSGGRLDVGKGWIDSGVTLSSSGHH